MTRFIPIQQLRHGDAKCNHILRPDIPRLQQIAAHAQKLRGSHAQLSRIVQRELQRLYKIVGAVLTHQFTPLCAACYNVVPRPTGVDEICCRLLQQLLCVSMALHARVNRVHQFAHASRTRAGRFDVCCVRGQKVNHGLCVVRIKHAIVPKVIKIQCKALLYTYVDDTANPR